NDTVGGFGNVISGNTTDGVDLNGVGDNVVLGNFIGTNAAGTAALPNAGNGVHVENAANNTIGSLISGERNVISGNLQNGVLLEGSSGSLLLDTVVEGNFIGTDAGGTAALGNAGDGVRIDTASNNTVGGSVTAAGNTIAFNGGN